MLNISTARLTIRETDSDTVNPISEKNQASGSSDLFSALSDNEEWLVFANKDALCDLLSKLLSYEGNGERLVYGIWLDSTLIGYLGLKNPSDPVPEIQIEFDPEYQNQGYGYEALSKMIDHLFAVGHKCLRYIVKPSNKASIALVEKVGGELQPPDSEVERILLRTYLIHSP